MRYAHQALELFAAAIVLSTLGTQDAFGQIVLRGTVPTGRAGLVLIQPNKQTTPPASGVVRFKFSAPAFNAGVAYALNFCIGPVANPCGLPTSYVVVVPSGQERLAVVDASFFTGNVLLVAQGTRVEVPFEVTVH